MMEKPTIVNTPLKNSHRTGAKKIIVIIVIFVIVVIVFQTGLWYLGSNPNILPPSLRSALTPDSEPIVIKPSVTPQYLREQSIVVPEFKVGGIISLISDEELIVDTFAGSITVDLPLINSFYVSTPDNIVIKKKDVLSDLYLVPGDVVSLIQNNQTYAIIKFSPNVE